MQRQAHLFKADLSHFVTDGKTDTKTRPSDPASVFRTIGALPWTDGPGTTAYEADSDGHVAVRVAEVGSNHVYGQLARSRRKGIPPVELRGKLSALQLEKGAGLFEAAHFVLHWDGAYPVLTMEYNHYAPRHGRLGTYLVDKLKNHASVTLEAATFTPIVQKDVFDQIANAGPLASVEVVVPRSQLSEMRRAVAKTSLFEALIAQDRFVPDGFEMVGLYMARPRYAKSGGSTDAFKTEFLRFARNALAYVTTAVVRVEAHSGNKSSLVDINLLHPSWSHTVSVVTDANDMVDSAAMFKQLSEIYRRERGKLFQSRAADGAP